MDRRAREDQRGRAAVHGRRRRRRPRICIGAVRRHDRAPAQGGAMNFGAIELTILLPALAAGAARDRDARAARHAGARARHRLHRPRDRADRRLRRAARRPLGFEPEGVAVQVAALAAALGGALLLTWTERVWPDVQEAVIGVVFVLARDRQRAAAREQRARQRAPARPAGRADPLGAADAARLGRARVRGDPRAVVRLRASGSAASASTCCSRSR